MSMVLMRTDLAADPRVVRVAAATKTLTGTHLAAYVGGDS